MDFAYYLQERKIEIRTIHRFTPIISDKSKSLNRILNDYNSGKKIEFGFGERGYYYDIHLQPAIYSENTLNKMLNKASEFASILELSIETRPRRVL